MTAASPVGGPPPGTPLLNPVLRKAWAARHLPALRWRLRHGFRFQGHRLPFLIHTYNNTWVNERQVEVPVARQALREAGRGARVLEVGNVLAHYGRRRHTVVDKYEQAPRVRNEDFLDHLGGPYDLIVSVSTFEHIGFDEPDRDATKFGRALQKAWELLAPGGRLIVTVPLGYNPAVDAFVQAPPPPFQVAFLQRVRAGPGGWAEVSACDPAEHAYGSVHANANAVAVVTARKPA